LGAMVVSVNRLALPLVEEMIHRSEELRITVERTESEASVIDAGVKVVGGYQAGRYLTEICLGGLGNINFQSGDYDGLILPSISVWTDMPAVSLLGSQSAGWRLSVGKYFAMGSGPARALAKKPKELYAKIEYSDESDVAVVVLEATEKPSGEVLSYIADECGIRTRQLYALVVPTSSIAGSVQISGRIAEMGLHKLMYVGFDPKKVLSVYGVAPIAPVHPKFSRAMGRTNDMLLFAGVTYFLRLLAMISIRSILDCLLLRWLSSTMLGQAVRSQLVS